MGAERQYLGSKCTLRKGAGPFGGCYQQERQNAGRSAARGTAMILASLGISDRQVPEASPRPNRQILGPVTLRLQRMLRNRAENGCEARLSRATECRYPRSAPPVRQLVRVGTLHEPCVASHRTPLLNQRSASLGKPVRADVPRRLFFGRKLELTPFRQRKI